MKLVIFGIDGTLCDFNNIDDTCFIQAFKDIFDIDITETNWDSYEHVTDTGITNRIFNE